jgi:hypothetical protein
MKLVTVTWSYDDYPKIEDSFLHVSFLKNNKIEDFHNIHFNRNNYKDLESQYNQMFGNQYEFLLYRIHLLNEYLKNSDLDEIIFADTNDVVCLNDINTININPTSVIFSSERHRYPNEESIQNWTPNHLYPEYNKTNELYLNGGLSCGKKESFIRLFDRCINEIFPLQYKNFGGDQGVFTYFFINLNDGLIKIDETKYFLSTYLKSHNDFRKDKNGIYSINNNSHPIFLHDNGWNYGSPKFINHFNLL